MAKLIVTSNGTLVGEFPLNKECLTIGRKTDNDIQIDNLAVSGHHAQIINILNDSFIEDLNSTNGTFVNSKLIRKHALRDGDVVTLGQHQLQYVNELAGGGKDKDFERTTVLGAASTSASLPGEFGDAAEQIQTQGGMAGTGQDAAPPARMRILSGNNAGKELSLTKPLTTLGKPGVAVAAISRRANGYYIIHVEGEDTGTRLAVNGEPIGKQARPLHSNDVVEIIGIKMEFFVDETLADTA